MNDSLRGAHWEERAPSRLQQLATECTVVVSLAVVPLLLTAGWGVSLLRAAVSPRAAQHDGPDDL